MSSSRKLLVAVASSLKLNSGSLYALAFVIPAEVDDSSLDPVLSAFTSKNIVRQGKQSQAYNATTRQHI